MVLMALDHGRDFTMDFSASAPTNLSTTTVPLFFTRWITHFCAPVFVLLTGVGAAFAGSRRTSRQLSWFLLTRGLWLILLEVTVVRLGWTLNINYHFVLLQVIWAIGCSMVVLAGLVHFQPIVAGLFGTVLVLAHNLLDSVHASQFGSSAWLWYLLHEHGSLRPFPWMRLVVGYPLVPWVGVMAAGYWLGTSLTSRAASHSDPTSHAITSAPAAGSRLLALLGVAMTLAFVIVRAINHYGNPNPWSPQPRGSVFTFLSFLNCDKYPPSLDFLLMTLGPSLIALALLNGRSIGRLSIWLRTFGRVPLFFYLLHLFVLHIVVVLLASPKLVLDPDLRNRLLTQGSPGFGLGVVYLVWAIAIVALYFPCRWYAGVKQHSRNPWLSYL